MAVVANISVLLSAKVDSYRSDIAFARKSNQEFGRSAKEAGFTLREIANGLKLVKPELESQQAAMERYKQTVRSLDGLQRSGLAKQLGISGNEIDAKKRAAFLEAQAAYQGKESPASIAKRANDQRNQSIQRGLALLQREDVALKKLRQDLLDVKVAADANKNLYRDGSFVKTRDQLLANYHGARVGNQIPDKDRAEAERTAAANRRRIEAENLEAIRASQTADQKRYAAINQLRNDEFAGLSKEASARRQLAIEAQYNANSGRDTLTKLRADIQDKYNLAVKRGISIANSAKTAADQYRQTVKDVGKALQATKISQEQYNNAKLLAKRTREDSRLDPIVRAGLNSVAPYKQVVTDVTRNIENMRAALKSGAVNQKEFDAAFRGGLSPLRQYANALTDLRGRLKAGELSQREFALAAKQSRTAIFGQTTALQRLLTTFGVFRTVLIGMASAQLYGAVFEGLSDGFSFEPQIRKAIAKFGSASEQQRQALRDAVVTSTDNDVSLLERAQVLEELAKDGVKADVAIRSLGQTLKFASVSGVEARDAVSLVSEVVNAYGLKTDDAALQTTRFYQTMDLLTAASIQTASDVYETAQALIRFAPEADQLGISIREAAQGVIAFSELGIKGEVAGNEFAIALRDLKNNAIENEQAFKDLGIEVFSQTGKFRGVSTVVGDMAQALDGLSAKEKAVALESLGVTQKGAKFQQQLVTMIDVIKTAKTSFDDTKGVVDRLNKESLTELTILSNRVRTGLSNMVNNTVVRFFEEIARVVNAMTRETRQYIATVTAFAATFTTIVFIGPAVVTSVAAIVKIMQSYAVTAAFIQGLQGPKGWVLLASGLAAASVAAGAMYLSYSSLEGLFTNTGLSKAREELSLLTDALNSGREDIGALRELLADSLDDIGQAATQSLQLNALNAQKDDAFRKIKERSDELKLLAQETDLAGLTSAKNEIEQLLTQIGNFSAFDPSKTKEIEQAFASISSQMDRIRNSLNSVKNPFSPDQLKQYRQELASITQSTQTPFERAAASLESLQGIKASIGINPVIEQRQIRSVLGSLADQLNSTVSTSIQKLNTAAELRGGAVDFSARYTVNSAYSETNERRQQHREQIQTLSRGNQKLDDVVRAIRDLVASQSQSEASVYRGEPLPEY